MEADWQNFIKISILSYSLLICCEHLSTNNLTLARKKVESKKAYSIEHLNSIKKTKSQITTANS